ncbi:MAG TPA: mechanosensitive ion channel domain-containing protein [Blastocatellia bacterium]|nr:mechanosensitive ion channel domain-containing protein [Blastocatellia bacterium]
MLFQEAQVQEAPQQSSFTAIFKRITEILNTPLVQQEGQFKVSIMSLIMLILVIVVAAVVSRYLRRFLQKRVMPRFHHLDRGLQFTLLRILHYVIMLFATLWAIKLGFSVDLTGIAVILGFLSVGIGFGLQYVAADLASGFILLFERPMRVGDRIKLDDSIEGRVENISLRSTIVVTNENMAVIVPNSRLVQNRFINYSYSNKPVRLNIPVGVAYGSDLQKVSKALVEAAKCVKDVLPTPAPRPHFKGFGDSSLDFEVRVWISEPHKHPQIRSKINYQIDRLFRQYEIEIPFPTRDLNLRSGKVKFAQNGSDMKDIEAIIDGDEEEELKSQEALSNPRR